jgi:hypothetical protein
MKNIILEELSKAKLLMNYNTKATLSENLIKNKTLISNNSLITEQPTKSFLKALFGVSDDFERNINALRNAKDVKYVAATKLFKDAGVVTQAGFKNADELMLAMAKGTLKKDQIGIIAKGLLKKGQVTGNLRTTLTNKAADITMKDARYANQSGSQIKNTLTKQKGYDPAIADEIALKVAAKRSKVPVDPNIIDDVSKNITKVPINFRTAWQSLKRWGLKIGLSIAAIAIIYSYFNSDPIPEEIDPNPNPKPKPEPRYRVCTGTYTKGCKTDPTGAIGQVQKCLGLVVDGKFWDKTQAALVAKNFSNGFKDSDITTICGQTPPNPAPAPAPAPSPEVKPEEKAPEYVDANDDASLDKLK